MHPRAPIPTSFFALAVIRLGHRFLLTQEHKYGNTWSLPGGRVEPGENLLSAAMREVQEETGIPVRLDGILRIEHAPAPTSARVRVFFAGSPIDDTKPRQIPDDETLGAAWLTLAEIAELPLRGTDLLPFLQDVARGMATFPLLLLGDETSI